MTLSRILLLLFLIGQTPPAAEPIHTAYDSYWKWTEIKTNWLYVLNDPDQFLQVKLIARFNGKQMPKTGPTSLEIEVISHSPKFKYVGLPELVAIADGNVLTIGKMQIHQNLQLLGMFKGGKEDGQSMVNQVSPVPASAVILVKHKQQDLSAEWLVTNIAWEDLSTLAKAEKIGWKLGDTEFPFNDIQKTRVKQFVTAVTPESGVVVIPKRKLDEEVKDKPTRTDTPSDANKTSVAETLEWLRQQIRKYGDDVPALGTPQTLALKKFDSCNIEWELAPPLGVQSNVRNYLPPTLVYSLNLKDLEPSSVILSKSGDHFTLGFSTHNQDQLIKLRYRDNSTGVSSFSEPRPLNSASFWLKKNDIGPEMREALSHAIRLCQ